MIVSERKDLKANIPRAPKESWGKYTFFSDPGCEERRNITPKVVKETLKFTEPIIWHRDSEKDPDRANDIKIRRRKEMAQTANASLQATNLPGDAVSASGSAAAKSAASGKSAKSARTESSTGASSLASSNPNGKTSFQKSALPTMDKSGLRHDWENDADYNPLGSRVCTSQEWDKYYFFGDCRGGIDPSTGSVGTLLSKTARNARARVSSYGPNTFDPKFIKGKGLDRMWDEERDGKLEVTSYMLDYQNMMNKMRRELRRAKSAAVIGTAAANDLVIDGGRKKEKREVLELTKRIFPKGHVTSDELWENEFRRPHPKATESMSW